MNQALPMAAVLVSLLWCGPSEATVWTVGMKPEHDFASVQDAIDVADNGDEIHVHRGEYVGAIDFLGKAVEVRGVQGRGVTRLDVGCDGPAVFMDDVGPGAALRELTLIANCDDPPQGAPFVRLLGASGPVFEGLVIFSTGGAARFPYSPPSNSEPPMVVNDCAFIGLDSAAYIQTNLSMAGAVEIGTVLFAGDPGFRTTTFALDSAVTLRNVLINSPWVVTAHEGSYSYLEGFPGGGTDTIRNLTVAQGQPGYSSSGIDLRQGGRAILRSNILAHSNFASYTACPLREIFASLPSFNVAYSDAFPLPGVPITRAWDSNALQCGAGLFPWSFEDPTGTDGNISADPMFVNYTDDGDWTNDNFCLAPGSPAIDAGDPDPAMNDPDGTRNDMGAFGGPGAPDCTYMLDADGDDWMPIMGDCDDGDATVFPLSDAEVVCDGIDSDCDTEDPPGDRDGDGFDGIACGGQDCDEEDASSHPGGEDLECDGIDQDCDGGDAEPPGGCGDDDSADDDDSAPPDDDDVVDDDDAVDDDDSTTASGGCECSSSERNAAGLAAFLLPTLALGRSRRRVR
jgi:hypothetical protein